MITDRESTRLSEINDLLSRGVEQTLTTELARVDSTVSHITYRGLGEAMFGGHAPDLQEPLNAAARRSPLCLAPFGEGIIFGGLTLDTPMSELTRQDRGAYMRYGRFLDDALIASWPDKENALLRFSDAHDRLRYGRFTSAEGWDFKVPAIDALRAYIGAKRSKALTLFPRRAPFFEDEYILNTNHFPHGTSNQTPPYTAVVNACALAMNETRDYTVLHPAAFAERVNAKLDSGYRLARSQVPGLIMRACIAGAQLQYMSGSEEIALVLNPKEQSFSALCDPRQPRWRRP